MFKSFKAATCLYSICLLIFLSLPCVGQQLIASSGNSHRSATIEVDWSMGEVITETFSDQVLTVTQGFHQPLEIVTGIELRETEIRTFPNPFNEYLIIDIQRQSNYETVSICNSLNSEVYHGTLDNGDVRISTVYLPEGFYYLRIFDSHGKLCKTVKLVKTSSLN